MGNIVGAYKIASKKIGIPYQEYMVKIQSEKWCTKCKKWHNKSEFNIDRNRGDGLSSKCHSCIRVKEKKCMKGRISPFKGKYHSAAAIKKMKKAQKGRKSPMEGKKHSLKSRKQMSETKRKNSPKGNKCHSYKDGKLKERRGLRFSIEYKRWRYDVFVRDNFTCQKCGDDKGGNLNAHHKKPFAYFPELRFDINNGITLCNICHKNEHYKK